jgi:tRNA/rRNA methyltransferase
MRVVLVEPRDSRNVGAVARAMANFGFSDLRLVSPRDYDREQAGVTARDSAPILDNAVIHHSLADAVADRVDVVGFALRTGPSPARCTTLPDWAQRRAPVPTALVFGPEDDDLRHEHLDLCRWIVRIPSDAGFPSLNLAQSVLVALYELSRTAPHDAGSGENQPAATERPDAGELAQLDRLIQQTMHRSGFVRPGSPRNAARTIGTLLRRMDLDRTEAAALTALFGRLDRALARGGPSSET